MIRATSEWELRHIAAVYAAVLLVTFTAVSIAIYKATEKPASSCTTH